MFSPKPKDNVSTREPLCDIPTAQRGHITKASNRFAIICFGIFSLAIACGGWWVFDYQKQIIRQEKQKDLATIATMKARQITEWRQDKTNDAELLRNNRILAGQFEKWLQRGTPFDAIHQKLATRLNDLLQAYDYHSLLLLDTNSKVLLQVGEKYELNKYNYEVAQQAMATQLSQFAEVYFLHAHEENHVHFDLAIPLIVGHEKSLRSVGAIVIRFDPGKYLIPLVESWPTQRKSAETVLMKPTATGVLPLSGRRHLVEAMVREIKVPTDRIVPVSLVFAHQEGALEHLDYRKVPALSYITRVVNSPWYLVSKIDKAEIFAPIHRLAQQISLLVVAFISLAGSVVYFWWRQMWSDYQASQYQAVLDKKLLEQRFHALTKHANDIILLVNQEGQIVEVNDRAVEMFGYPREQMIGMPFNNLRQVDDADLFNEQWEQLKEKETLLYEALFTKSDGTTFLLENNARGIKLEGKTYFQGILRDVSERKKAEEQIQYLAHHDSLTGLPNRNLLQDRLTLNLARARRNGTKSAILFLDFDRFKNINDSLGHSVGDAVLKEVAHRLKNCLREGDTVARVGGDEFIILMSDLDEGTTAAKVARKVTDMGTCPYEVEGLKFRLTISIGISIFPDDGKDIETLLKNADSAMYHAKKTGRDTFHFYTEDMNAQTLEALTLENDLQRALSNDEFTLHYQPQIDLRSGKITGTEALLRWQHPQHGNMSPEVFIPIAEERGLIVPIGDWVLETACRQIIEWQQQGLPAINMAVNISALQLQHADFYEKLVAVLSRTGMLPEALELELTESAVMQGGEHTSALLQQLKALGIRLAMDDFGTGYSSLSYLKQFPIDKLKIDRSFIKDLPDNTEDKALTQAIIGIAQALKIKVIAEGVETLEQQQFLQHEGCNLMQGFYFSRPIPAEEFAELLSSNAESR